MINGLITTIQQLSNLAIDPIEGIPAHYIFEFDHETEVKPIGQTLWRGSEVAAVFICENIDSEVNAICEHNGWLVLPLERYAGDIKDLINLSKVTLLSVRVQGIVRDIQKFAVSGRESELCEYWYENLVWKINH